MKPEKEIEFYKKIFPTIKDWNIEYHQDSEETSSAIMYHSKKEAIIRRFRKGSGRIPKDYIFHEMLHIIMSDLYLSKEKDYDNKEESVIRGLCRLFK